MIMFTKYHLSLTAYGIVLTILILTGYNYLSEHFQQKTHQSAIHFELKADPKDIIHSEAYTNTKGEGEVKYAYLAEPVTTLPHEDVTLRTSQSQTIEVSTFKDEAGKSMRELKTTFLPKPQFYQDKDGVWRQIEYATTTEKTFSMSGAIPRIKGREFFERLTGATPVFANTATYYPDANTESTSVDGFIESASASGASLNAVLLDASNQTDGVAVDDFSVDTTISSYNLDEGGGAFYAEIYRSFFLFDTSGLGAAATISAATFSVYVTAKSNDDNDGTDYIRLVTTTPASNTTLVTQDFDQISFTAQTATSPDITSISTAAYQDYTLNATGIGNVSKTGITKFGLREGHDIAGSGLCQNCNSGVGVNTADQTGTTNDPKLVVTYTTPVTFSMGDWFEF
jgi:hypothetical protein